MQDHQEEGASEAKRTLRMYKVQEKWKKANQQIKLCLKHQQVQDKKSFAKYHAKADLSRAHENKQQFSWLYHLS